MRVHPLLTLRGIITAVAVFSVMVIIALIIVCGGCFAFLMPTAQWRRAIIRSLRHMPILWAKINRILLVCGRKDRWDIQLPNDLSPEHWYLLIANHRSWTDILVLVSIFSHNAPLFKFFYKRELIWTLPVAGLAMWFLDYPHIIRYSRDQLRKNPKLKQKNIEQITKSCELFRTTPTTAVNFVEGTRFSTEKHQRQQSPYRHLLIPKVQGIAMVTNALADKLDCILDVNIVYKPAPKLWDLFCGRYEKISVHCRKLPLTPDLVGDFFNDRQYRQHFRGWLSKIWQEKDEELEKMHDQS